jgi:hypothetical protein
MAAEVAPFSPSRRGSRLALHGGAVADLRRPLRERRATMNEHEHPKGALAFMLLYLLLMALLWTNAYLKLWGVGA